MFNMIIGHNNLVLQVTRIDYLYIKWKYNNLVIFAFLITYYSHECDLQIS